MKSNMNYSAHAPSQVHLHAGSTEHAADAAAGSTRYTCTMHPEVVRDAPGSCPKCGMTLVPML